MRLIDAEAAEEKAWASDKIVGSSVWETSEVVEFLDDCPTIEAAPVVHSKWDTVFYESHGTLASYSHLCPECKYFYRNTKSKGHKYCPECGAKMDGAKDG